VKYAASFPEIYGGHSSWRYTLISGLIPAIPLLIIRPFLPESPVWKQKRDAGTLKRPRFAELFEPALRRTTITTTILFACAYGAAFGAIQLVPSQIVPGLPQLAEVQKPMKELKAQEAAIQKRLSTKEPPAEERAELVASLKNVKGAQKKISDAVKQEGNKVQGWQEMGGLTGRVLLAILAPIIISRVKLLRVFQIPGMLIIPFVFLYPAQNDLELLKWGMALAGLFTVAQFSFWGNYLPRVYPVHLRGTGESFAANIGGRMIGTSAAFVTTNLVAPHMPGVNTFAQTAQAAAIVVCGVYVIGVITSCWLPEPPQLDLPE
jgi:hypothetical protein